jgi:hypothetical protein
VLSVLLLFFMGLSTHMLKTVNCTLFTCMTGICPSLRIYSSSKLCRVRRVEQELVLVLKDKIVNQVPL